VTTPARVVAVVSDGSAPRRGNGDNAPASLGMWVDEDAAVIHELTGLPVRAVPLTACDADDLAAQIRVLALDAGAIFLTRTDPDRARSAQHALHEAGGPSVLTDADTTTITVTAVLLTTIARAGREPAASRVVIAGAAALPELCPLLIATGIGDISSWHDSDAHAFPLHLLTRHATAVIDLLGATTQPAGWVPGGHWSSVLTPDDPGYRLLPAPGLLAALVHYPDATLDLDVFRACALALTAATPPGKPVPEIDDPHLTEMIASAVFGVLAQRASSRPPQTTA